jgi:hypothetical protein
MFAAPSMDAGTMQSLGHASSLAAAEGSALGGGTEMVEKRQPHEKGKLSKESRTELKKFAEQIASELDPEELQAMRHEMFKLSIRNTDEQSNSIGEGDSANPIQVSTLPVFTRSVLCD